MPFGYVITNSKKMLFEVDEPSAEVVRKIFELYIDGWGYKRIANHLTDEHIPTPRMREKARKEAQGDDYKGKVKEAWSVVTISEILCNDFYIGTLRQHKYKRKKINGQDGSSILPSISYSRITMRPSSITEPSPSRRSFSSKEAPPITAVKRNTRTTTPVTSSAVTAVHPCSHEAVPTLRMPISAAPITQGEKPDAQRTTSVWTFLTVS